MEGFCPFWGSHQSKFCVHPFKALDILEVIASKYGLPVVVQDESYSSQASCLDLDQIPTYGDKDIPAFSGKRVHRGLYRSKNKILLNADVNGAPTSSARDIRKHSRILI